MVYLIVCEENGTCKIGYSYDNAKGRLASLRCASPYDIELKYWVNGDYSEEKRLHEYFSKYKLKREWFSLNDEILEYFSSRSAEFVSEESKYVPESNDPESFVSVPVVMKQRMKRRYKPEELSVMITLGERIHNLTEESARSTFQYISLITKMFGHNYPELKAMVSFLCSIEDRWGELVKERNDLLEFIDSKEIHESADEHWIDVIEYAKTDDTFNAG